MIDHLGDDAELYPLGVLDDDAAREVERHIAGCDECAARVAGAQRAAASLSSTVPAFDPPPVLEKRLRTSVRQGPPAFAGSRRWDPRSLGLAAAFAAALTGLGWQTLNLQHQTSARNHELAAMVHSHFRHVPMTSTLPAPFGAKVLYAPDGSWIFVVVDHPGASLHAVGTGPGGSVDLGALENSGETASLLVRPDTPIDSVELRHGGQVQAEARLIY